MKKLLLEETLLVSGFLLNAQTISLGTDNEYCPNVEYEFTVTLPGPYSSISATQMLITQQPYAFNTSNTSFKFKAKFNDVNIKQYVEIKYGANGASTFKPEYKKVKSFFYTNNSSCGLIQPKFTSNNGPATIFNAPLCQVTSFNITFSKIKWYTEFETPAFCFGSISDYEYLLPAGWKLGSATSNGTAWLQGTNTATITSDISTGSGSTILIKPKNTCITPSANGQIPVQIIINRPNGFTVTPANVPISCGSTTPVTFTINNINNVTGITDYTWNLGTTPNGWLLPNGNPAPATYSTGNINTLTLTPICGITQNNVSASVTVNGISCNASASIVTLTAPTMNINGNMLLCSGSSVYTLNNVPCNASVTWSASPASGIISLSPNGNSVTVTKTGNGRVGLVATVNACNNYSVSTDINVGGPTPPYGGIQPVTYYPNYCAGETYYFELLGATGDANQYQWNSYGPTQSSQYVTYSDRSVPISFPETGTYEIVVVGTNSCGSAVIATTFIEVTSCGWVFSVSPNPSRDNINISPNTQVNAKPNVKATEIQAIEIIDKMGVLKKRQTFGKRLTTVNISVSQLPNGIYTLRIFDGKQWHTHKIVVQH